MSVSFIAELSPVYCCLVICEIQTCLLSKAKAGNQLNCGGDIQNFSALSRFQIFWKCFLSFTPRVLPDRAIPICRQLVQFLTLCWKYIPWMYNSQFSHFFDIVNIVLKGLPVTQDLTCTTPSGKRVHITIHLFSFFAYQLFLPSGLWNRWLTQIPHEQRSSRWAINNQHLTQGLHLLYMFDVDY